MQITSYNPHLGLLRSEHCWGEHRTVYSAPSEADVVMASIGICDRLESLRWRFHYEIHWIRTNHSVRLERWLSGSHIERTVDGMIRICDLRLPGYDEAIFAWLTGQQPQSTQRNTRDWNHDAFGIE